MTLRLLAVALATSVALVPLPGLAQTASKTPAGGTLEPEATGALDKMGAYLRTLTTYEVKVDSTFEEVYDNGQKLQFLQQTRYLVGGPDKIYVANRTVAKDTRYYYDGKTLSIFSPRKGFYTQADYAGNIDTLLQKAYEDYGVDLPLEDLFRWGSKSATNVPPREGFKVGDEIIGPWLTTHYAFRQAGADYQVWIDQGDKPLPRKIVITNTEDPAQPQYVAYLRWNLEPKIEANQFTFTPGTGATRIRFADAAARAEAAAK